MMSSFLKEIEESLGRLGYLCGNEEVTVENGRKTRVDRNGSAVSVQIPLNTPTNDIEDMLDIAIR